MNLTKFAFLTLRSHNCGNATGLSSLSLNLNEFVENKKVPELKAYILCRFARKSGIYSSWMDECSIPSEVISSHLPDWHLPSDAGIVITHMHHRWEEMSILRKTYEEGRVPVLILSDGILEYRNSWEHPDLADGSMYQPVIGHKLACIGRGQVRVVESWGNPGKCELVGLPRLDSVERNAMPSQMKSGQPLRLLIATANTPSFNPEQREAVVESLSHLKTRLEKHPKIKGRPLEITWRLTDGLEQELGLPKQPDPDDLLPLATVIEHSDAVVTTPSTLMLESMLKRRPTALLDFHNAPQYVPCAWSINAPKHLNWILNELAEPPPAKMMFQEHVLQDQLEFATPAKPRMIALVNEMVEAGRIARNSNRRIELPLRVLEDKQQGFARVADDFNLANLYPDNPVFKDNDVARIQVELSQAIKRLETLPRELIEKNRFLHHALAQLDRLRVRNARMHQYVVALRARFNILPANPRKQTNVMDANGETPLRDGSLADELGES